MLFVLAPGDFYVEGLESDLWISTVAISDDVWRLQYRSYKLKHHTFWFWVSCSSNCPQTVRSVVQFPSLAVYWSVFKQDTEPFAAICLYLECKSEILNCLVLKLQWCFKFKMNWMWLLLSSGILTVTLLHPAYAFSYCCNMSVAHTNTSKHADTQDSAYMCLFYTRTEALLWSALTQFLFSLLSHA